MTDHFAVFGLPHRPLVDEAALKERYLEQAAIWHPDAVGGDTGKFREVQAAYKVLSDAAARLRHLLELNFPDFRGGTRAFAPGDLFLEAGRAVQSAKEVFRRAGQVQSPLSRALLAQDKAAVKESILETLAKVRQARRQQGEELVSLDARWPHAAPEELGRLASGLAFLSKWESELAEWEFRLECGEVGG